MSLNTKELEDDIGIIDLIKNIYSEGAKRIEKGPNINH